MGNVLVFLDHNRALQSISRISGLDVSLIEKILLSDSLIFDFELGLITSEELYNVIIDISPNQFSLNDFSKAASDMFTINQDIIPILKKVKEKNIKLILISNTNEIHWNFLKDRLEVFKLFDQFVLSFKVKSSKPDEKIYKEAVSSSQALFSECLFIDDIKENIDAAKSLGIKTHHFINNELLKKKLESLLY